MFHKVIRDLTSRKMRTVLVVLSVAIGVFGVSAVGTLSSQLQSGINDQYHLSNPPDITMSTSPLAVRTVNKLNRSPNVKAPIEARIASFGRWSPKGVSKVVQVIGMRDFATHNTIARSILKEGNFPTAGQVLFESSSAKEYNIKVGQTVRITGKGGDLTYTVSGRAANSTYPPAKSAGFATLFLNWKDAARLVGSDRANALYIKVVNNALKSSNATAAVLRNEIAKDQAIVNSISVADPKNPPGNQTGQIIGSLLGIFAVIALITSSFLVINTIATVVAEQRSQIGSMKAIGATTGAVVRLYLMLALLYGMIGTVVGLILGILGSFAMLQLISFLVGFDAPGFKPSISPIILGIIVGLGVPMVAALLPVWLGSRVTIREAITSYGLGADFGKGILARIVMALRFLPVSEVLASRNMIRNRSRVVLTVLGLAFTGACIIGVFNTQQSLASSLDKAIKTYKADIIETLGSPQHAAKVQRIVGSVPGVQHSEGWFITNVQNGDHLTDTLNGIPVNTAVYDISRVVDGRWYRPGDTRVVVITESMAKARKFSVGQVLPITVGSHVVHWKVVGITRDLAGGATTFFAPIAQATGAAGVAADLVQQEMIKLRDPSHASIDKREAAINNALVRNGMAPQSSIVYKVQDQILSGFTILFVLLYLVVFIVAVVGALGLLGTITMNVLERRKEIGVMRSVGASTRTVLMVFLSEGILIGVVGWVFAIILGFVAATILASLISGVLLPIPVTLRPASLIITLFAILVVAFVSTLMPSIAAARTQIAEILRYG